MDKYLYKDEQWMNYTNKQTDRQTEKETEKVKERR